MTKHAKQAADIRVGMGGWSYAPWRETFYPPEVKKTEELRYASRQVTAIEINSTFYGLQKPAVFAKWRDMTPDGFVFALKAPRFATQRKILSEARLSVTRFVESGIVELKEKLGPILWQLAPTHRYEPDDLRAFLELLPKKAGELSLRHALNVRHKSFANRDFIDIAREHGVGVVFEDDADPAIADATAEFIYARLRKSDSSQPTGYSKSSLHLWAKRAKVWASGGVPDDLTRIDAVTPLRNASRDVFLFFINGAKERAPAAAQALIRELK